MATSGVVYVFMTPWQQAVPSVVVVVVALVVRIVVVAVVVGTFLAVHVCKSLVPQVREREDVAVVHSVRIARLVSAVTTLCLVACTALYLFLNKKQTLEGCTACYVSSHSLLSSPRPSLLSFPPPLSTFLSLHCLLFTLTFEARSLLWILVPALLNYCLKGSRARVRYVRGVMCTDHLPNLTVTVNLIKGALVGNKFVPAVAEKT